MKKAIIIISLLSAFISNGYAGESLKDHVKFATVELANELLLQEDEFTNSWSQFDIDSRMQKPNSSKKELFDYIITQTLEWSQEEKKKINTIFDRIDDQIKNLKIKIDFPKEIVFIKTTALEEGGANGYTRANYVVLKNELVSKPIEELEHTVVHELFHILSRSNQDFREAIYKTIGFHMMEPLEYPDHLKDFRITNPDAPQTDSYIELEVDGISKPCMMILFADKKYEDGSFFDYLKVGFLPVHCDQKNSKVDAIEIYEMSNVKGFFEQVGSNTNYIIHPEEILAENFTHLILGTSELPNPEILDKIKEVLVK